MPTTKNRTVLPRRKRYEELRPREYLTEKEVEHLRRVARKRGRYGHRDATMILLAYRHGLRTAEASALRWDQIDLEQGLLHVRRLKNGIPSVHPLGVRSFERCANSSGRWGYRRTCLLPSAADR